MIDLRRDMTQLWALFLIALHDDAQSKIVDEMMEICGDDDRAASEMKYLERALKGKMGIYPSVPSISRKMSEDLMIGEWDLVSRLKAKRPSAEKSPPKSH